MEALVQIPAVGQEQIAEWLNDTAGSQQESTVRAATLHLEAAQTVPKFALFLLMLSAGKLLLTHHFYTIKTFCCVIR